MTTILEVQAPNKEDSEEQLSVSLLNIADLLGGIKDDVLHSHWLLQNGAKTALSQRTEESIKNPVKAFLEFSSEIDNIVCSVADQMVRAFFKERANKIHSAYLSARTTYNLHYTIVLKNNRYSNRVRLNEFFIDYNQHPISSKCCVYFQVVPLNLIDRMERIETISLS